jgi:hypothetical protein
MNQLKHIRRANYGPYGKHVRQEVQTVGCPVCGAPPHVPCESKNGIVMNNPHMPRMWAYKDSFLPTRDDSPIIKELP